MGAPEDAARDPLEHATTRLVRDAQADRRHVAELYRRVAPAVFAWASLRLKPPLRGVIEPEDVVQEVWCRTLERLGTYDPERASFRTWVFAIANHVMLHAWRRMRDAPPPRASTVSGRDAFDVTDDATSISRAVARDEELHRIVEQLSALDEDERKVLIHCGLEGLSAPQAAPILGASADAVAKRWQRLRARLKDTATFRDLLAG